ncbi:hypothetical protein V461_13255 [Pantoea ananatis BRT98]|nr:hypothetical protein V461_13255 [Pantoea ananatis BRT98]
MLALFFVHQIWFLRLFSFLVQVSCAMHQSKAGFL